MHLLPTRLLPDQLSHWRARLPVVAQWVLGALLLLQLGRLVWLALAPPGPVDTTAEVVAHTLPASPALPRADVFFRSARVAGSANDKALSYTLFGVRSDGDHGSAILGKDGEQASYAIGREVATGIVLESVGIDHAVLSANGVRHRLELPPLATAGAPSAATTLPAGKSKAAAPPAVPGVASPPGGTTTTLATPGQSPSPVDPAASNGDGYVITPGVRAALLRPAGLRPGDVVLSVNGRPLDTARLAGLRNELKGQSQVTIQYRRDGKTHTTTVQAP